MERHVQNSLLPLPWAKGRARPPPPSLVRDSRTHFTKVRGCIITPMLEKKELPRSIPLLAVSLLSVGSQFSPKLSCCSALKLGKVWS